MISNLYREMQPLGMVNMIKTPVWNPCFVHAGCTPGNVVACAKKKNHVKP